mgnify:FL=1
MERAKSSPQAGTQQSGISSDEVVNPQHYRRLTLKQTMDSENVLLEQDKVIDFPLKPSDLSRYDEVLYE